MKDENKKKVKRATKSYFSMFFISLLSFFCDNYVDGIKRCGGGGGGGGGRGGGVLLGKFMFYSKLNKKNKRR